jgi:capsular polysaccharide biosynthesis protein
MLLVALVGIAGFATYAQVGSSSYEASAIVRVNPIGTDPFASGRTPDQLVNTDAEAQNARSVDLAERLAELLGSSDDADAVRGRMSVKASSDTASLTLTYTAGARQAARDGANAYAQAFLDQREAEAREQQEALLANVEESLNGAREDLIAAEEAEADAEAGSREAQEAAADRQIADRSIQSLSARRGDLQSMSLDPGRVLREAESASPASLAGGATFLAGGVLASLVLALLAAFAREGMDKRAHSARDIGQAAHAPVLAEIPRGGSGAPLLEDSSGPVAEAYRQLRAQLLPALRRAGTRVIVVADPGGAAPSGTAGAGLAVAIAQAGHDVVLLMPGWPSGEAAGLGALDGARASQGAQSTQSTQAFATLLRGAREANGGEVVRLTSVPGLRAAHGDAAHALVAGEDGQALVADLAASGGYVVLDASGRLSRSEILTLAGLPGAVAIVVGQVGRSTVPELEELALSLERLGTPIAGCAVVVGRAGRGERSQPGDREDRGAPAGGSHRRVPPARSEGAVRA